jgi:phosphatidylglycerol:prolipoprotein diacylglycerol transferase
LITINIDPVAFTIGSIEVRWYGIMIALAVLTVVLWVLLAVRRGAKLSYDTVITAAVIAIPSGIIFSRLLHVVDNLVQEGSQSVYFQNPGQIIGAEGLTIYGAVLGATLAVWIYSRFSRFNFSYFVDVIAPGIILAQAIGRVGCVLNGCCYGVETRLPWAIVYTNPNSLCPIGVPVHPTQLYEIIFNLLVFGLLLTLKGKLRPDGSLYLVYISMYSLWRFGIGFLREGTPFLFGLHQAQFIGLVVLAVTVPIMVYRMRWVRAPAVAEDSREE